MKKLYLCLFSLGATTLLIAQPIVEDKFNYGGANGDLVTVSAGNWAQTGTTETNPIQYTAGSSLSFPGFTAAGGMVTLGTAGGQDINRTVPAYSGGSIYYAALVRVTSVQGVGDYFMHFSVSSTTTTFLSRVFARPGATAGTFQFGLLKNSGGTTPFNAQEFQLNTTYAVVVKYTFVDGGTTNDIADLFVFDASTGVPNTEPATPFMTQTANTDAASIAAIALRQGGSTSSPGVQLDNIVFSDTWSGITAVLPSRLIDFQVSLDGQNRAVVKLMVDNDGSAASYELEQSTDGRTFRSLTTISSGDRRGIAAFTYVSPTSQPEQLVYYRARLILKNGQALHSKTVPVRILQKGKLLIAPNPVAPNSPFTISLAGSGANGAGKISIYSADGKLMHRSSFSPGTSQLTLTVPGLLPGMYRLVQEGDGSTQATSFVIR